MATPYSSASHANEWRLWPHRENVTLREPTALGVYANHTLSATGGAVKRRALTFKEMAASAGAYTNSDRAWLIPEANLPAGKDPAPGWVILDGDGVSWTIGDVTVGKFGQTHKCVARALEVVNALSVTATLRRPVTAADAAGRPALANYTTVGTSLCRVQPEDSEASELLGRVTIPRRFTAYLATPLTVQAHDRFEAGGVVYTALGFRNPERIWDLMSLTLEAIGPAGEIDSLAGLVAYYPLGDESEVASGLYPLSLSGAEFAAGLIGNALADGSGEAEIAGVITSAWSISGWLRIGEPFTGTGGSVALVLTDVPDVVIAAVTVESDGEDVWLNFGIGETEPLSAGWHHFVLTYSGSAGGLTAYIDGGVFATGDPEAGAIDKLTVAAAGDDATNPVDELAVYTAAIAFEQVAALYNDGAGRNPLAEVVPEVVSAETDPTGNDVIITFNVAVAGGAISATEFVVRANGVNLGFFQSTESGANTLTYHADVATVQPGDTVTLDYSPGTVVGRASGLALEAFTGFAVENNVP